MSNIINQGEENMSNIININGIEYVPADQVQQPTKGARAVVIVDRGWIFAGDVTRENGRIKLTRAILVVSWESIGFDGMIADPKSNKVKIRPIPNSVDIPEGAEVFSVPVTDNWGL